MAESAQRSKSMVSTPAYFPVQNYELTEGEFITEEHLLGRASVVLIGPEAADTLFGRHDGITGETIRIEGQPFRILGVLASKGGGAFGSQDNRVIIPFSTAQAASSVATRATRLTSCSYRLSAEMQS